MPLPVFPALARMRARRQGRALARSLLMTLTLRPARPDDATAIADLFTRSRGLLTFLPILHTADEDRGFVRDVVMAEMDVTVAEGQGRILGFMAEKPDWVVHLYVAPEALRQGIGSALMRHAQARQARLNLWCFAENRRGLAFYTRHGFVVAEETDGSGNESRAPDKRLVWSGP